VALDGTGRIYVADGDWVQLYGADGGFVQEWTATGAWDLAVSGTGEVLVVDRSFHRVRKFGPDGQPITDWGGLGNGEGRFATPSGIAVDSVGNVYVADTSNARGLSAQKVHLDLQAEMLTTQEGHRDVQVVVMCAQGIHLRLPRKLLSSQGIRLNVQMEILTGQGFRLEL